MSNAESLHSNSLFHKGELEVQRRVGVRNQENLGRRNIRNHMPLQHQEFYQQQPLIFIAAQDKQHRPWASVIVGRQGFIDTPTENEMVISALPFQGEPIREGLTEKSAIGLLGLEFHTQRRNRMNGRIQSPSETSGQSVDQSIHIRVDQAFGNCPKFIHSRMILKGAGDTIEHSGQEHPVMPQVQRHHNLSNEHRRLIETSDTFFIASQYEVDRSEAQSGIDISHRGGKPGFVKFTDDNTIQWPDFSGNDYFSTLGNLEKDSRSGLLFMDFATGSLLSITGKAQVIWDDRNLVEFQGAERFIRFTVDELIYIPNAYPLKWSSINASPFLESTDDWTEFETRKKQQNQFQPYKINRIEDEAKGIRSFYLQPHDGHSLPIFKPGQFLPIKVTDHHGKTHYRSYSLSDAPGNSKANNHYRISVKQLLGDDPGIVSNLLHDKFHTGSSIEALSPRGEFVLNNSQRPIVLLSAGVGITPMISMLLSAIEENLNDNQTREIFFIHGTRNEQDHGFRSLVNSMAETYPWIKVVYCYSQSPAKTDRDLNLVSPNISIYSGHVNKQVLQQALPINDYEFYLCGPDTFMASSYELLAGLSVSADRIYYESFGPSSLIEKVTKSNRTLGDINTHQPQSPPLSHPAQSPVVVKFSRSDKEAIWQPGSGSLLDLAESQGINPTYGCRSGQCHSCSTSIEQGEVHQITGTSGSSVLICCATPEASHDARLADQPLVLDL